MLQNGDGGGGGSNAGGGAAGGVDGGEDAVKTATSPSRTRKSTTSISSIEERLLEAEASLAAGTAEASVQEESDPLAADANAQAQASDATRQETEARKIKTCRGTFGNWLGIVADMCEQTQETLKQPSTTDR